MKPALACVLAMSFVTLPATAGAEPLTHEQRKQLVVTGEAGDAWLHDHCSFRGVASPSVKNATVLGQVVELIDNGQSPLVKEFRCAERPPFWKGPWASAPAEAVACTEPKPAKPEGLSVCVPPLVKPIPPLHDEVAAVSVRTPRARTSVPTQPPPSARPSQVGAPRSMQRVRAPGPRSQASLSRPR